MLLTLSLEVWHVESDQDSNVYVYSFTTDFSIVSNYEDGTRLPNYNLHQIHFSSIKIINYEKDFISVNLNKQLSHKNH